MDILATIIKNREGLAEEREAYLQLLEMLQSIDVFQNEKQYTFICDLQKRSHAKVEELTQELEKRELQEKRMNLYAWRVCLVFVAIAIAGLVLQLLGALSNILLVGLLALVLLIYCLALYLLSTRVRQKRFYLISLALVGVFAIAAFAAQQLFPAYQFGAVFAYISPALGLYSLATNLYTNLAKK